MTGKLHVSHWGTFITTPKVSAESATVNIKTKIKNEYPEKTECILTTTIVDQNGQSVIEIQSTKEIDKTEEVEFEHETEIASPQLWSLESPYLYKTCSTVRSGDEVVDTFETTFGIREIRFDAERGFLLNGKSVKLNGVCLHHDLGCLGAACFDREKERLLE